MEKKIECFSKENNYSSSTLTKAAGIFFSTIVTNLLLRHLLPFTQAVEIVDDNHEKRSLLDTQQASSIINFVQRGQLPIVGIPNDIKVQGNFAFVATQNAGLQIIDISNTRNPLIAGKYNTTYDMKGTVYPIHEIEITGSVAYLAEDTGGLRILDITNPTTPLVIGGYFTGWPVVHISIVGVNAWLIDSSNARNFAVIDVSVPSAVRQVTGIFTPGYTFSISGSTAYVASQTSIQVVDISNSAHLKLLATYSISSTCIYAQSNFLYVCVTDTSCQGTYPTKCGLQIINVSNPPNPQNLGFFSTSYPVNAMNIKGTTAYLIDSEGFFYTVNISNPTSPSSLGGFVNGASECTSLAINSAGTLAYASTSYYGGYNSAFSIFNITDPTNVNTLQSYYTLSTPYTPPFIFNKIATRGNLIYLAGSSLLIFDISNVTNPAMIGSYDAKTIIYDIKINGSLAYLANSESGLQIVDISDPKYPKYAGSHYTFDAQAVIINNNIIYVVGNNGLVLINNAYSEKELISIQYEGGSQITDTLADTSGLFTLYSTLGLAWLDGSEKIITTRVLSSPVTVVASINNTAYIGVNSTLEIIDLTNLSNPALLGNFSISGSINDISIQSGIAYIAAGSAGLQIVDVSNSVKPKFLGSYQTSLSAVGVRVIGSIVYLIDTNLEIINVINPANPQLLSSYSPTNGATSISVSKSFVYLTDTSGSLQIIDLHDPINPQFLISYQYSTNTKINYVSVIDNIAYLTLSRVDLSVVNNEGLYILDVSNPANPIFLGSYIPTLYHNFYLISVNNNIVMATDDIINLNIIDVSIPSNPQLLGSYHLPAGANCISFNGYIGLVADNFGLRILSPSPLWNSRLSIHTLPQLLTSSNNYTYVVDSSNMLHVIDSHSKLNLTEISASYKLIASAQSLTVSDNFLYVAELTSQLTTVVEIIDVSNVASPRYATQITNNVSIENALTLSSGQLFVVDSTDGLLIYDIEGQPLLVNHQFAVIPGIQFIVTGDQLSARDTNAGADPLRLTFIISNLQNGQFQLSSQLGISITNFTQLDIVRGDVLFVPSNLPVLPSFQVSITNGPQYSTPQSMIVMYAIDSPQIVNNSLTVNQGQTVTLTNSDLSGIVLIPGRQLTFSINQIRNGRFQSVSAPGIFITSFMPQDISQGTVQFVATGGGSDIPSYQVVASDGFLSSLPSIASINYDAAPQLTTNQLSIVQGSTVTLGSSELQATDVDNDPTTLLFIISGVKYGSFNQLNFTQKVLMSGSIKFTQDGSDQIPIYYVNVTDGRINIGPQQAVTSLTPPSANSIPSTIGGVAAGTALIASAIGLGFWFRKRTQDASTRKQHPFADHLRNTLKLKGVDNFESAEGQRYLIVIQKMERAFSTQGGMNLSTMGDSELRSLAIQVANSAMNKITPSTRCGYSIIRSEDIDDTKISAIVQEVLQMRVGKNDTHVPMASF